MKLHISINEYNPAFRLHVACIMQFDIICHWNQTLIVNLSWSNEKYSS